MDWIITGIVFVYGIVFGSFYNVVIYRVPLDKSITKGRSMCPSCSSTLRAKDLVPLFSWLLLGGKCRYCSSPISPRYPIIESVTGILFVVAYLHFGMGATFVLYCSFYSMLLITTMIDWDHMIVSDEVLIGFSIISAACLLIIKGSQTGGFHLVQGLLLLKDNGLGLLIGFFSYGLIYWIARAIYKQEAFGSGDVVLMGAIGLVLGVRDTVITAFLAFYIAIFYVILMKVFGKKFKLRDEIPFGPYMCMAAFIASLYGNELFGLYMRLLFG